MILGDLGADIIKIESPAGGDSARFTPPHFYKGESIYFMALNRNKKSVAIDLSQTAGRRVFYDLVSRSDVVLDNLRYGVLEKSKINYEVLRKHNPKIISCSINGYGSGNPDSPKPSFDLMIQAKGGGMSLDGRTWGRSASDGCFGIRPCSRDLCRRRYPGGAPCARADRKRPKNRGPAFQRNDLHAELRGGIPSLLRRGPGAGRAGHRALIPYNAVRTKDGYIVVDAHLPKFWSSLCRVLDIRGLEDDPKFRTLDVRNKNREELLSILDKAFGAERVGNGSKASKQTASPVLPSTT